LSGLIFSATLFLEKIMFSKTARYYDKIYAFKDYRAEVLRLEAVIREHLRSEGNRLLDVACGTGHHLAYLKEQFDVEGLDISQELLAVARRRNPGVLFHQADMTDFDSGYEFDVVTCLFSSIGYVKTLDNLTRAVTCMARHLTSGGILVIEPWFSPDTWRPGTVHASFIDEPELKIARINTSFVDGRLSFFDLHYLIGTPEGTEHFVERHELGLFEMDEVRAVLAEIGLEISYDAEGLTGRGLFIGRRSR
jgi:ubiquinone/menaquinone biosynthesis C-methylase UbiE